MRPRMRVRGGLHSVHFDTPFPRPEEINCEEMAVAKADPRLSFSDQYQLKEDLGK